MYQHCIHCAGALGKNAEIPTFPVGGRLAFDSARGRLWVICPACLRWNLTPLEERWEAVETCERVFGGLRQRVQTTNVGYARARSGLDLIRIGRPLRPEFAAWRYGREFTRRRRQAALGVGVVGLAAVGAAIGSVGLALGAVTVLPALSLGWEATRSLWRPHDIDLPRGPGRGWDVAADGTMILPSPAGWRVVVRHHFGRVELEGPEARRLLAQLLTRWNRSGGSHAAVNAATALLAERAPDQLLVEIAGRAERMWALDGDAQRAFDAGRLQDQRWRPRNRAAIVRLPAETRLALEMALHEGTEQRAAEGELAELEAAWREAEEIAGIADALLIPADTEAHLRALQAGRNDTA